MYQINVCVCVWHVRRQGRLELCKGASSVRSEMRYLNFLVDPLFVAFVE